MRGFGGLASMGMVVSLLVGLGCGGGSASESSGQSTGGSGGTGGVQVSGGTGGDTMSSSGGTSPSTTTITWSTPNACGNGGGFPGLPGAQLPYPYCSNIVDLDGDQIPDLVECYPPDVHQMRVLLGDGTGWFSAQVDTPLGGNVWYATPGDMNGDGLVDLVTLPSVGGVYQVLLGNGDGSFSPEPPAPSGLDLDYIEIADLNGDARPDLVIGGSTPAINVHLQLDDGTFAPSVGYDFGGIHGVHAADLDGDGDLDLIGKTSGSIRVLANLGNGTFEAEKALFPVTAGAFLPVDLNEDGRVDIVTMLGPTATLHLQEPNGKFAAPVTLPVDGALQPGSFVDFDKDGHLDIVTGHEIAFGAGDGTFPKRTAFGSGGSKATPVDLDKDGHTDLLTWSEGGAVLFRAFGRPDETLDLPTIQGDGVYVDVAVTDMDADGTADLVLLGTEGLSTAKGHGDGTFDPAVSLGPDDAYWVLPADLNGDGKSDVVTIADWEVRAWIQGPNGTFDPPVATQVEGSVWDFAAADFDEDGLDDLVVANLPWPDAGTAPLLLLRGQGTGTFDVTTLANMGGGTAAVATADLDGDGNLDIAAAPQGHGALVFYGHGDGTFDAPLAVDEMDEITSLTLADVDADGLLDIVSMIYLGGPAVMRNLGNGLFDTPAMLGDGLISSNGAERLFVLDVTNDEIVDLVEQQRESLRVCVGTGDGHFSPCAYYPNLATMRGTVPADLDGDGKIDFVAVAQGRPGFTVLRNTCAP